jgi:hypothetical protein
MSIAYLMRIRGRCQSSVIGQSWACLYQFYALCKDPPFSPARNDTCKLVVEILLPNSSCTVHHTVKEPTVFQRLAVAQKQVNAFTSTEHRFPVKISGLLTIPLPGTLQEKIEYTEMMIHGRG